MLKIGTDISMPPFLGVLDVIQLPLHLLQSSPHIIEVHLSARNLASNALFIERIKDSPCPTQQWDSIVSFCG